MKTLDATPNQAQPSPESDLEKRMDAAWPDDRIRALGDSQADRLSAWVEQDRVSKGEEYLTVPVLQGMLEMLETYYPEESSRKLPI